jgi:hypothetical protein
MGAHAQLRATFGSSEEVGRRASHLSGFGRLKIAARMTGTLPA